MHSGPNLKSYGTKTKTKAKVKYPGGKNLNNVHTFIITNDIQDISTNVGGDRFGNRSFSQLWRTTWKLSGGMLMRENIVLYRRYHPISSIALRYWFTASSTSWKMQSGPMLKSHKRAHDGRYRQYSVCLWEEVLFSIGKYHRFFHDSLLLILSHLNSVKMHSGPFLKSQNRKTKAELGNPARQNLHIVPEYHNHQQYSGYHNKWRRKFEIAA